MFALVGQKIGEKKGKKKTKKLPHIVNKKIPFSRGFHNAAYIKIQIGLEAGYPVAVGNQLTTVSWSNTNSLDSSFLSMTSSGRVLELTRRSPFH